MSETARTDYVEAGGVRVYAWPPKIEPPCKAGRELMTTLVRSRMGDSLNDLAVKIPMEVRVCGNILGWKAAFLFDANSKRARDLYVRNRGLLYTVGLFGPDGVKAFHSFAKRALGGRDRDALAACGLPSSNALVRLIQKSEIDLHNRPYISKIAELWQTDRWARKVLPHLPRINTDVIQLLQMDIDVGAKLLMDAARSDLGQANVTYNLKILHSMWRDAGGTAWPYRELTADQVQNATGRLYLAKIQRQPYPQPPLAGTDEITPIRSPRELFVEGKRQRNCCFTLDPHVREGTNYIYRYEGEAGRATVALAKKSGYWALGELRCYDNAPPPRKLTKAIIWWLEHEQPNISRNDLDMRFAQLVDPPETEWDNEEWDMDTPVF